MPKPDEDDYSGTPCPAGPPLPLAFLDDEDDDDDTFEDITMALPDDSRPFLSMHRRKKEPKGLREPPRRITGYVPTVPAKDKLVVVAEKSKLVVKEVADAGEMHPVEPARMKLAEPEKRPQAVGGGVGKKDPERQAHTRRADMEPLPPQPPQPPLAQQLEPEPRHYAGGIHQQPQRTRGGITKAPSRRRVSAILKAKKEQDRAPNPILSEKTINSPIIKLAQKQSLVAQKLIQPPKRRLFKPAPALAKQQPQKLASWRDRTSGKENAAPADRKRALGRSPPRKSARLSDVPARVPMRAVAKSVPLSIKPVERSRKRVSDDISFDEGDSSFTSQVSGYTEAPGSLRLKKRFKSSMGSLPSPPGLTQEEENEILPPSKTLLPGLTSYRPQANRKRPLDPVLNDDIERCEMYEESWLSAQESSVSQLLNQLLSQYSPAPVGKRRLALRKEFLVLYAAAPFPMIYNRVHASLLYGALSITQAILDKSSVARISRPASTATGHLGWGADIGTRQGFLELFMGSYEQSALITALEVVVGREMFAYMQPGESEKKVLEAYLDRYIIRSEDILSTVPEPAQGSRKGAKMGGHSAEDEDRGTPAWLLRRSMLRSLMVIILLDKAKARGILGRQCLFKKESRHKSSASVLNSLARLLLPSVGDILKSLSHLNYSLEAVQGPLAEFDYAINNLAVDIRDGVRLARVVEVLLYSKQHTTRTNDDEDWPLSPHLQYPAPSRAQKMHNVSLVLSTLNKSGGYPRHIEASDIVDGHREKTVGLLWSLLCQYGLALLLDWDQVARETRRFEKMVAPGLEGDYLVVAHDHVELLKHWARNVAVKYGLLVENLTTSFADGRVFAAIVSEYEQYLPSYCKNNPTATLADKLRGIGCNSYFAGLFDAPSNSGRVFSKDFVIAALTYLCSRLVQPSIQERSAITIQRAFRRTLFQANLHRRINLLMLAHRCADVVNRKHAAITIQRAYRRFLHDKIQKLIACITGVQALGRGAIARGRAEERRRAAVVIQRMWREVREARFRRRIGVASRAVVGVQALSRGVAVRRWVAAVKRGVGIVEPRRETILLARRAREAYLNKRGAARVIQRAWRRYDGTREERRGLVEVREAIVGVQALARGWMVRVRGAELLAAVTELQRRYRQAMEARRARTQYSDLRNAALVVQRRRRETVQARERHHDFLLIRQVVAVIKQRFVQKKQELGAALVLQRAWRERAWIVRMHRTAREATVIQSAWRGYLVRKECGPRLRIVRRRVRKTLETPVRVGETIGARTRAALEMVKSSKAGFGRGVAVLETHTANSRECALVVVEDEAGVIAIASFLESAATQILKTSSSTLTQRALLSGASTIANIARVPTCCTVLSSRALPKGSGKDLFGCLLQVVETLKGAVRGTTPYEVLLATLRVLLTFCEHDGVLRRLKGRRRWVERLVGVVGAVEGAGRRRGAAEDGVRSELLERLLRVFA